MARQINPSLARLWQDHDLRLYGSSQKHLVKVESEAQNRALDLLENGLTNSQFDNLSDLAKIDETELNSLLNRLAPLIAKTTSFLPEITPEEVESRFAEILRLFSLGDADPAANLKKRRLSQVFVSTLSRPGLLAIKALYTIGVGKALTFDGTKVRQQDVCELGYNHQALGLTKHHAAQQMLSKSNASLQLHSRLTENLTQVNAAILISNDVVTPDSYQTWLQREVPHISVCFTETGCEISHVVMPGKTPCLGCLEISKSKRDPDRIAIATQLTSLNRDFADSSTLLSAIGIAIGRIAQVLDGREPRGLDGKVIELSRTTGEVVPIDLLETNCACRMRI